MLELNSVSARFGSVEALRDVSISVEAGEIVCLIGANGAGKSTILNVISGLVPAASGYVSLDGESLAEKKASEIVRRGVVQVPEGRLVFPDLTVRENLEMGAYTQDSAIFKDSMAEVVALFPLLQERHAQLAGYLSGGQQQMLAIGRALMARPRLLLLDEPSMGLAPLIIADIFRTVQRLRTEHNCTILLVEQNAKAALKISDRGYVLANGRITGSGLARELVEDREIQKHYLGKRATA